MKIKILSLFENVDFAEIAAGRLKGSGLAITSVYTLRNSFDPLNNGRKSNFGSNFIDGSLTQYNNTGTFDGFGHLTGFYNFKSPVDNELDDGVLYNEVRERDETVVEVVCDQLSVNVVQNILRNAGGYNIIRTNI